MFAFFILIGIPTYFGWKWFLSCRDKWIINNPEEYKQSGVDWEEVVDMMNPAWFTIVLIIPSIITLINLIIMCFKYF